MEAKDTVMSDEEIEKLLDVEFRWEYSGHIAEWKEVAQAQAKISFPKGIKEVVEWLKKHQLTAYYTDKGFAEWQAQLKKWGIDYESIIKGYGGDND